MKFSPDAAVNVRLYNERFLGIFRVHADGMQYSAIKTICLLVGIALAYVSAFTRADTGVELEGVRAGFHGERTRIVFDLSAATAYRFFLLQGPDRAVIDLDIARPGANLLLPQLRGQAVAGLRSAVQPDGRYRFVFDLNESAAAKAFYLAPNEVHGHRVVVDIEAGVVVASSPPPAVVEPAASAVEQSVESPLEAPESEADSLQGLFLSTGEERQETVTGNADTFDGFAQFGAAYTVNSPTHLSLARTLVELSADGRLSDNITWKVSARAAYDAAFDLDNFYPERVEDNRQFDADFYENYLDIAAGDLEFRLGRQHIIWGEMVGLFFADVVSAKDMRQFVVQDFDLIRIPQWAARAEYYSGDYHAELIWVPVMTYNEIGKPGDDFYPLGGQLMENPNVFIRDTDEPSNSLSNSAYGLRFSGIKRGWDISGFYYRSVDAEPAFFSEWESSPDPRLVITPRHKKIHQMGATLAKDFGPVVLKSEAIYTVDRYYVVEDATDSDGVEQQDILDYVVGLEHTTPANTLLNVQLYQRWYTDHSSANLLDEFETGASLFGKWEFSSTLDGELMLISQFNREDWLTRPRLTWHFAPDWFVQFGADIFGGEGVGLFGRFDNSDRIYTNIRYTF